MPQTNKPVAKNQLSNINIYEIAFAGSPKVDEATIALMKSNAPDGQEMIIKSLVELAKDDVKKQIYCYALVPDSVDHDGDVISAAEIEKARDSFMSNLAKGTAKGEGTSENHSNFTDTGYPIEIVIDTDGTLAKARGATSHPGGLWVGLQCTDVTWAKVQKGDITGVSVGGYGKRTPIPETDDATPTEKSALSYLKKGIKLLMRKDTDDKATLAKADTPKTFNGAYAEDKREDKLWDLQRALTTSIRSILESDVDNQLDLMASSVDQYKTALLAWANAFVTPPAAEPINLSGIIALEKALVAGSDKLIQINKSTSDGGSDNMNSEQEKKIVDSLEKAVTAVEEMGTRLDALEKANEKPAEADPDKVTKAKDGDEVTLDSLAKRLDKIESTPGERNGADGTEETVAKGNERSVLGKSLFPAV